MAAEYKAKAVIEVRKNEKVFSFECDNNTPLGQIFDALNEMRAAIIQTINDSEKKEAENKASEAPA